MSKLNVDRERRIEDFLRKNSLLLYAITLVTAGTLYLGIYYAMLLFNEGFYWSILISGLLAHSFFVITMHDGAHQAITKSRLDHIIMTICSGLIILPIYTELFKKYHLLHHAYTNKDDDPLWTPLKAKLFMERRLLYAFLQCLPFAFNLYIIIQGKKDRKGNLRSYKPNYYMMLLSILVAGTVIYFARPNVWFVLGSFTVMTALGAIRYWGEHMGIEADKDSNTHWFPLGMGIGNHDVHHHHPNYSWLTLTIGMLYRKMDTNPFKSTYRMFFNKEFRHYKRSD